jgi:CheY-like chemotaxis protein
MAAQRWHKNRTPFLAHSPVSHSFLILSNSFPIRFSGPTQRTKLHLLMEHLTSTKRLRKATVLPAGATVFSTCLVCTAVPYYMLKYIESTVTFIKLSDISFRLSMIVEEALMFTPYMMMVESNPILAKRLLRILHDEMGFQVRIAPTKEEALTTIQVHPPILLLLDAFLLDGDSLAFSDHVHQQVVTAPLPTILLRKVSRCHQWIGNRHIRCLPLPINSNDLAQAMRTLLEEGVP